jgi:hypothetical protein
MRPTSTRTSCDSFRAFCLLQILDLNLSCTKFVSFHIPPLNNLMQVNESFFELLDLLHALNVRLMTATLYITFTL